MKKIFTTLAAVALMATAANAEVVVKYNGEELANGAEIEVSAADFKNESMPEFELYMWSWGADLEVEAGDPSVASATTDDTAFQFCPAGGCLPWNGMSASKTVKQPSYTAQIHYTVQEENIPAVESYLKCTFVDDDEEPFVVTFKLNTKGGSAVEGIDMENAKVAAIYDMQGRRVADDFRGAAIVVYDNGKALKQIRK